MFCEGDSWFSTPLTMNLLDWLVFPTPEEEELGIPIRGRGGLFYRDEATGSQATDEALATVNATGRFGEVRAAYERLLKDEVRPWIGPHLEAVLPGRDDRIAFARKLIDGFAERVLFPLTLDARFKHVLRVVDLRQDCPLEAHWFDEMHPTGASFHRLSARFKTEIRNLFVLP